MSEPIKVGDLVIVLRPSMCCPQEKPHIGRIFTVSSFETLNATPCERCGDKSTITVAIEPGSYKGYDIRRLKRIPPIAELGDVKRDEEITA